MTETNTDNALNFIQAIESGSFVLTGEIAPPKGPDLTKVMSSVALFKGVADAVNVTDNQRAVMRMGNLAVAANLVREGIHPIMQITCRDRNSISLQSDLLGAHSMGVRSVLALTGDPVKAGDHQDAKAVFDLSSVELLKTIGLLNQATTRSGKALTGPTRFFAGAACDPTARNLKGQLAWMEKKVEAGARFFQTQAVYSAAKMESFRRQTEQFGIPVLAGILLLKSAKMARFLNEKVPGIDVPDHQIKALEESSDPIETGIEIAEELMREMSSMAEGLHVMSVGQDTLVAETLRRYREDYL